jgi:hypothetical protein
LGCFIPEILEHALRKTTFSVSRATSHAARAAARRYVWYGAELIEATTGCFA